MTTKKIKRYVQKFLTTYAPSVLEWGYQFLHDLRLGIYTIAPHVINEASFLEKVDKSIGKKDKTSSLPLSKCHIVLYTHGLSSGGAERQWCYLANELARRGYTVTLLTNSLAGEESHYLPLLAGSPVQVLAMDTLLIPEDIIKAVPSEGLPYDVYRCILAYAMLNPSHILIQLDDTNICGGVAGILYGGNIQKIILSFRNVNPTNFKYLYKPFMKMMYLRLKSSSRIVLSGNSKYGNSDYAAWLGIPEDTVGCIYNALEKQKEQIFDKNNIRDSLGIKQDALVILGVFRLSAEKNPNLFLQVIRELRKQFSNIVAIHAGVGQLESSVHACARKYQLDDTVLFLGTRKDIPQLMHAADMLLLTSDHEGLPNVVLEAQAAALPVVATRVGGVPEAVIEGKTALLAPRGDVHTLVSQCSKLLDDAPLRISMGRLGKAFVCENFSHNVMGERTLRTIGLPSICPSALQVPHTPLVQKGSLAKDAYFLRRLINAASGEPLVFFVEDSILCDFHLSQGSLCIVSSRGNLQCTVPWFLFDWTTSSDWSCIVPHLSHQKVAVFASETCLSSNIRQQLLICGFTSIIFSVSENIYQVPVVHPSLVRRLCKLFYNQIVNNNFLKK